MVGVTQERPYDLGPSARGNGEIHDHMRDEDPKIATQAFALPAGLIDVEVWNIGESPADFFRDGLELEAEPLDTVTHGSNTKVQPEKRVQDLYNASSANSVYGSEVSDGAMNSRTELAWGHLGGNLRPGLVSTSALELVASVLGHDRLDFRQLKRLIPQRLRGLLAALGVQRSRALLVNLRIAVMDMKLRCHYGHRSKRSAPVCDDPKKSRKGLNKRQSPHKHELYEL